MQKDSRQPECSGLFGRVVSILETSRTNVVRSVNAQRVTAYWLIGREIVEEIQRGKDRAAYGRQLTENVLENAPITQLQQFFPELGNDFAFVARQMRISLEGDHFYPDLIFYHIRLKCHVVVDLKLEKLTHGDVGQMQLHANCFDQKVRAEDDNSTVGLLLCTEKNDSRVRYIPGEDNEQVFASKYRLALPAPEMLEAERRKERCLIEEAVARHGAAGNG